MRRELTIEIFETRLRDGLVGVFDMVEEVFKSMFNETARSARRHDDTAKSLIGGMVEITFTTNLHCDVFCNEVRITIRDVLTKNTTAQDIATVVPTPMSSSSGCRTTWSMKYKRRSTKKNDRKRM